MIKKSIAFSGIQPTGNLHIGNYLGAISQWVQMQNKYNCIFCVVDYHAITIEHDPKTYNQQIIDTAKMYIAAGINPKKCMIFKQSDIHQHTELAWIFNCTARMNDLKKMTQFKDKAKTANAVVGLFDYPVLMAADILLYNTDIVPVGQDQAQHVELSRTIARRFNSKYGKVFKIPKVILRKQGARIMGLDNADKKMSKSAQSPANYIALSDNPKTAKKKIMKAQTDSGKEIKYDLKKKPAISNLLIIYSLLSGQTIKELERMYKNKGYGEFKQDLANITAEFLTKFQKRCNKISNKDIEKIFANSAKKLRPIAQKTMVRAKNAIGIK
ncbi:MAG: tryptophan--tRNA ligase [bacterium]